MYGRGSSSSWSQASSKVDLNISAITLRAATLLSERGEIGEDGCGDQRAAIKSRAAATAKSVDERNHRSCADVLESSPVGGCKYERCVRYVSTDEHS